MIHHGGMRIRWLVGGLASSVTLLAACLNDSSQPTYTPDAGFTASPDGGGTTPIPGLDSGTPDASPDTTPGAGVTLTVRSGANPTPNVRVLLHDATGAITSEARTDANGKVTTQTTPSQLTVLYSVQQGGNPSPDLALLTYVGLTEGDNLVLDTGAAFANYATFNVSFPGAQANAVTYQAVAGASCGDSSDTAVGALPLVFTADCFRPSMAVLGFALDANDNVLAFAGAKNVAPPAMNGSAPVVLPDWSAPGSSVVTASNLPNGAVTRADFAVVANGATYRYLGTPTGTLEAGGVTFATPNNFADAMQSAVVAELDRGTSDYAAFALMRRENPAGTATFDFAQALPRVTSATLSTATASRPSVSWTSAAPLTSTDGGYVGLAWGILVNPDEMQNVRWTFVVPPTATSVTAPQLPADATSYKPPANGVRLSGILFVESDLLPSYTQLKALPVMPGGDVSASDFSAPLPSNGNVRLSSYHADLFP